MTHYSDWDEPHGASQSRPSPFNLHDLLDTIKPRKKFIAWTTATITVLSIVAVLLLVKDSYESTAVIMPPRQEQSMSALLSGQAGGLASLGGAALGGVGLNLKNPNEIYLSMLGSRTLTTALVNQFNLKGYYGKKTTADAIKALLRHTVTELGKDNLIRITVTSHDATFSSQLANAFVDRLHELNTSLAITDSAQRRVFFEQQLKQEKDLLAQAETALQETQIKTGILQPTGQAAMLAQSMGELQAKITEREAALDSLSTSVTTQNPQYLQLKAQIDSLRAKLARLQNSAKTPAPGDIEVPTAQLPKASLEYLRKYRDVQLHEQLYALLLKQLEAAKIDEAKTAPVIQVIDAAIPAERHAGLSRWFLVPASLLAALFLNLLLCVCIYVYRALRHAQLSATAPLGSSAVVHKS